MLEVTTNLTAEQKQEALAQALHSETFARCHQSRSFLRYVCELEIGGQAERISEYAIGVEALGRPAKFAPGEDSVVRNQARALRQRLEEFYKRELPAAPVRIELPRGSYCPRFTNHEPPPAPIETSQTAQTPAVIPTPATIIPLEPRGRRREMALAFCAGVLLTGLAAWLLRAVPASGSSAARVAPIISEAWGPLLRPGANTLVCVATPLQTWVRAYEVKPTGLSADVFDAPPELYERYRRRFQLPENHQLYQVAHSNSPLWGDALGALTAVGTMAAAGASFQVLPERVTPFPSLRGRNLLLFGLPEYSPAVAQFLERGAFEIKYDPAVCENSIVARTSAATASYAPQRDAGNRVTQTYGLITVLPGEGADVEQRVVIFSGLGSAGGQAAAEFFASPHSLREFQQRLKAEGLASFPRAYQVIVKTTSNSTLPFSFSYETHRVL